MHSSSLKRFGYTVRLLKMNYYVTTSIPYVNGEPHLGHAMEFVMADVLARYARKQGNTVIFSTGTDEHGGKMAEKATELKLTPKQFVDKMSQPFADLLKELNISNDKFIRTTDPAHEQRAQIIWKNIFIRVNTPAGTAPATKRSLPRQP